MTKRFFLFLTFICSVFHINAQWNHFSNDSVNYVFADTAFVRTAPSAVNTPISDTLFAADMVTILENSGPLLSLKGISCPWMYVSYNKGGVEKKGYI